MDNSLIPRAFSPTDAKRDREANARLAERQSSARNASSSTIGEGGKLTLAGGIDVVDGGVVKVVGGGTTFEGVPYEVTGTLATMETETNNGPTAIPAFVFSSDLLGPNSSARMYSLDGRSMTVLGSEDGVGKTGLSVDQFSGGVYYSDTSPAYGNATGKYRESSVKVGQTGFSIKFRDDLAPATSAIVGDRFGNIDIQTTGALTQNGAPISGGGGGAVSSVAGKTGDVTLVIADTDGLQTALDGKAPTVHTHAIADTTGLQTALDNKGPKILPHWEKSGSTSTPDSTVWGPGVVSADPAVSTDVGLLTMINQDTAQIRDAGTYAISVGMRFPSGITATNGRSAISVEPMSGPMFAKGGVLQTDDQGAGSIPNIRLTAGQQFHIYIVQISGATRVMSYTVRVTKISN